MKFLVFSLILLCLSSCFLSKKKVSKQDVVIIAAPERTFQDTSIYRLLVSSNAIDSSNSEISYQYFLKTTAPWQDSINTKIADFIFSNCYFEIPENVKPECNDQAFAACLDTFVTHSQQDQEALEMFGLWSLEIKTSINDEFKKFATLGSGVYCYSGGAHGNTFYNHINIDKESGKTLKLNDFITDTAAFNLIAEACFRKQNEISENENFSELGFWFENDVFDCNDNFYISEFGFHFTYNVYEIAPYSLGLFEFNVPLNLCQELLKMDLSKK